jgi:PAS domain S-box-containing protein
MNLRTKIFLIISVVFIAAFLALAVLLRNFILDGYIREETQTTTDKIQQVQAVVNASITDMGSADKDWAEWDDSYQFMQDKNSAYIESNLSDSTFFNNKWNLAAYVDPSGNIVFSKAFDFTDGKAVPVPEDILAYLKKGSPLLAQSDSDPGIAGLISLSQYPMIVVSHPVLTNQRNGPFRGTLILGRYFDQLEVGRISKITNLSLTGLRFQTSGLPADIQAVIPTLTGGTPIKVQPLDQNTVAGYTLLKDIKNNPALILRVDAPRTIFARSQSDIFAFTLSLLVFGLLFALTILILLERLVLSRLGHLSSSVNVIGNKGDPSSRVIVSGKDEISSLAGNINEMLGNLEKSRKLQQESTAFNYALLQGSPNPIEVINADTSIRYLNPAFEKITGYSAAQLTGHKAPYPWWPQESIDKYEDDLLKVMTTGTEKLEKHFVKHNGEPFWVEITSSPIEDNGNLRYFITNWVDITSRKETERALRASEEFNSSLSENSPYPIAVINPDKTLRYINPALERLTGFSRPELVEKLAPFPYWPKTNVEQYLADFSSNLNTAHAFEMLLQKKTGESFWVKMNHTPIQEGGSIKYYLSIWMDITAEKMAHEELEKLYQREKKVSEDLQEEIRSRTEFTRALVHELKTPLTPILASSELLVEELTQEPLLGLAKNVHQGAENMNKRVDELLDLARGEVGLLRINKRPVNHEKLLQDVVKYMTPAVEHSGQQLVLNQLSELPVISADDDRIRQVLFNLINNAIKYSSPGGKIYVGAKKQAEFLVMEVQDNGRGMTEEEQVRLFEPYYRIESKEKMSGLGLGLALSRRLVELHGGQIWVKSSRGIGSTFYFSLPIKDEGPIYPAT